MARNPYKPATVESVNSKLEQLYERFTAMHDEADATAMAEAERRLADHQAADQTGSQT
jgi:hypothetical protein